MSLTLTCCEFFNPEIVPGVYQIDALFYSTQVANFTVEVTVVQLEITESQELLLTAEWKVFRGEGDYLTLTKASDAHNPNMYLEDESGRRYRVGDVSGAAAGFIAYRNPVIPQFGWKDDGVFYFQDVLAPGVHTLWFVDEEQHAVLKIL